MSLKDRLDSRPNLHRVSAMQVIQGENGKLRMGLMTQIELAPDITVLGPGFNERTLRIRSGEQSYFVFCEDLIKAGFGIPEQEPSVAIASV